MRQNSARSYVETFDDKGNVTVREMFTCAHCQRIYPKPGPSDAVGFCQMCFAPVCIECGKVDKCDPFERKLERIEQRARLLKSVGAA